MKRFIMIAALFAIGIFCLSTYCSAITIKDVKPGEDIFQYIQQVKGAFDPTLYKQIVGAANAFKEGDKTIGVGADDEMSRENARKLLANTKIKDLHERPLLEDTLQKGIWKTTDITAASPNWTAVNDFFDNIAVTTICQSVSSPQTIYFGSGEGYYERTCSSRWAVDGTRKEGNTKLLRIRRGSHSPSVYQDVFFHRHRTGAPPGQVHGGRGKDRT